MSTKIEFEQLLESHRQEQERAIKSEQERDKYKAQRDLLLESLDDAILYIPGGTYEYRIIIDSIKADL